MTRGRVLKVKEGYNPNSSSIGSALPAYLAFAIGSGAVTVVILNLLDGAGRLLRRRRGRRPADDEPSSERDPSDEGPPQD